MIRKKWLTAWMVIAALLVQSFSVPSALAAASENLKGLVFDPAVQNSVTLETTLENAPATFEMRAKFAANPNHRQVLFGNYRAAASTQFSIELKADNQFRYYEVSNGGKLIDRSTTGLSITTGEWTHLAVTRDVENKQVTLIQDGTVVAVFENLDLPEQVNMETVHSIGTDTRNSHHMRAEVAEVRLWSEVRTLQELIDNVDTQLRGDEQGLMHAWELDKFDPVGSTNVVPDVVGKINGAAKGYGPPPAPYQGEFQGTGTSFADGTLDLVLSNELDESPRTVEAWVNVPADTSRGQRVGAILGSYWGANYNDIPQFNFEINTNGNPRIYWTGIKNNTVNYIADNVNVNLGDWVHVAIVLDDSDNSAVTYINGEKQHEAKLTVPSFPLKTGTLNLKLGSDYRYEADGKPTLAFKGELADVRVWSTTRTAEEIKANYNTYLAGDEEGLLGNWKLDQLTDDVYADDSTQKNDAHRFVPNEFTWHPADFPDGDYRIAVIPDTQYMSMHPDVIKRYFEWMRDNAEELNIELVIGVGDIVEHATSLTQWQAAYDAYSVLDGVIPYVLATGNHDVVLNKATLERNYTNFNRFFPYYKYSQEPTFGGAMVEGRMENTYHFYEIGDLEYMVLSLEFAPTAEVLEWANEVVAANPDKRVIVTTHTYMYHNGERISTDHIHYPTAYIDDAKNGDDMWDEFVSKHENIILVVSGHIGYPDLVVRGDLGEHGNLVQQVLANAQYMSPVELGMIMMLTFKEGSNDVEVNWYTATYDLFYRERNQFTMPMNLYPEDDGNDGGSPTPTPPAPGPTPGPTPPATGPVDEQDETEGGESSLEISASVDQNGTENVAVEVGRDVVTIKIDAPQSAGNIKVNLDKASVDQIVKDGQKVVVQSPLAAVTLDAATLAQLAGSDVVIEVDQSIQADGKPARTVKALASGQEVTRFDGKVTVSIPYVAGSSELANNLVVYRLSGNNRTIVPQSKALNGEVVFIADGTSTFVVAYNEKTFADAASHWSNDNIGFVTARELFVGVSEHTFAPDQALTRGMLATVLGRAIGVDESSTGTSFTDVQDGAYYAPYIAYASEHGIVGGIGNGQFAPNREVTREEMARMIVGFMEHAEITIAAQNSYTAFNDESSISSWASSAIRQLQQAGILDGKPGNVYDPKGAVTRGEAAKVVKLLLEAYVNE